MNFVHQISSPFYFKYKSNNEATELIKIMVFISKQSLQINELKRFCIPQIRFSNPKNDK